MVILITHGMKYFTMEAVSEDSILAKTRASVHMCMISSLSFAVSAVKYVLQSQQFRILYYGLNLI